MKSSFLAVAFLLVTATAVQAQDPCAAPPPTGVVVNPTQVYLRLPADHTSTVPGTTVPTVTNYTVTYFPQGSGPTGTPAQGPITVPKTAFVLQSGTTDCYRSSIPATITVQGVTYVAYIRSHRDAFTNAGSTYAAEDSPWAPASNPFLSASLALAAPGQLVFRQ